MSAQVYSVYALYVEVPRKRGVTEYGMMQCYLFLTSNEDQTGLKERNGHSFLCL